MPNLVLIGFMGTGKTTVGKKLARRFGMKFVDTDQEIERITGMSINDIFKKHGQIRFRSEEKAAVRRICRNQNQVISTGGGVVLDSGNRAMLQKDSFLVCLEAAPQVIYERVKRKKNRPLLHTDDPLETIKQMLTERQLFYSRADYTVDTSNMELEAVVEAVKQAFEQYVKNRKTDQDNT